MSSLLPNPLIRLRPTARRRGDRAGDRATVVLPLVRAARAPEARARAAGGPVDLASYTCCCGMVFSASVSASVCCPACGGNQDW